MSYSHITFSPNDLKSIRVDTDGKKKWMTFNNGHRLFEPLLGYIAANLVDAQSASYGCRVIPVKERQHENIMGKLIHGNVSVDIGVGEHHFYAFDRSVIQVVYQQVGEPVGTNCEVTIFHSLVLFTDDRGDLQQLTSFLSSLVELMERDAESGKFKCFTWHIDYRYWREEEKVLARPIESVVLPSAMKERLIKDIEKFSKPSTKDFYQRNGIPYRRSYLFYGVPGTGKTSMVQALAGHFHRSVCFLMPTHPKMTDDSLREAMNQLPENTIVVFEDIDSLFSKDRKNQISNSSLTFSGLLNALDGIGNSSGQIFVLTTNLRENLDHALIRNGRVDLHVEFTYATQEQMQLMWQNFYPEAKDLSEEFARKVSALLEVHQLQVTTSALQHFFVTMMEHSAEEALEQVASVVEEIKLNSSQVMLEAATTKKKMKKKSQRERQREKQLKKTEQPMESVEESRAELTASSESSSESSSVASVIGVAVTE